MKTVYNAWDEIIIVLDQCFPEMEEEDWDNVKVNELLPIIIKIAKSAFGEMLKINSGNNSKN